MEGLSYPQKLLAEVFGTAMLVFVGVGSVPATLIVGGDAPFTMAQLGMISFAFAMIVVALIYAIGHVSGCQINPAITVALAATGKMPWREVPGYIGAQVVGAIAGAGAIIGVLGGKAVDVGLGVASYGSGCRRRPGVLRRGRRHVHPRLRRVRGDPQGGPGRLRRARHRHGRLRRHHSGGAGHGRVHQPGAHTRARCWSSRSPVAPSNGDSCRSTCWPSSSEPSRRASCTARW